MPKTKLTHIILTILLLTCALSKPTWADIFFPSPTKPIAINPPPEIFSKFTGGWDEIKQRRVIRFLVPYSKTFFFWDGAKPMGLIYEKVIAFEKKINKDLETRHIKIHAIIIPTQRQNLLSNLLAGYGDVAAANLTITQEREKLVDFSDPFLSDVKELIATNRTHKTYKNIFSLSDSVISVRKSSSYYTSLKTINLRLADFERAPINIKLIQDNLEDEDVLELIDSNAIDMTVLDHHKAEFWAKILPNIKIHPAPIIAQNGKIAWAIRKNSPQLKTVINSYIKTAKKGTLAGNMLLQRYLKNTEYIKGALETPNRKLFEKLTPLFEKYGTKYNFDPLMLIALSYQESKLDQNVKSSQGAVGIMQILPSTASYKVINIDNIENLENNIHAGTKYLRYISDKYFPESEHINPLNRTLFTFAAYNAGPGRVNYLRSLAKRKGYDPNVWFQNVEIIAAEQIGRETVNYVGNIYKYYITYKLLNKTLNPAQWPPQEISTNCSFADECTEAGKIF